LFFSTIYIFTIVHLFAKLYFFIVIDFFFIFYYIYVFFSFSCIIFGIFGALIQKKIRKLLAYSTITFIGYYLSAFIAFDLLTIEYALHYLLIYIFNLIGLFTFLLNTIINDKYFIDKLITLNTLHKSNHLLAFVVSVILFSISGMPPF
jgi:NADH-quinone oxidoreductase subunit N